MTKAQFIRWANRREKAAEALREARRLIRSMKTIAGGRVGSDVVNERTDDADERIVQALSHLEIALTHAAPTDNRTKER